MELHPQFLESNGQRQFVVLPVDEFESMREALEDLEDLLLLRQAVEEEASAETVSLQEWIQQSSGV